MFVRNILLLIASTYISLVKCSINFEILQSSSMDDFVIEPYPENKRKIFLMAFEFSDVTYQEHTKEQLVNASYYFNNKIKHYTRNKIVPYGLNGSLNTLPYYHVKLLNLRKFKEDKSELTRICLEKRFKRFIVNSFREQYNIPEDAWALVWFGRNCGLPFGDNKMAVSTNIHNHHAQLKNIGFLLGFKSSLNFHGVRLLDTIHYLKTGDKLSLMGSTISWNYSIQQIFKKGWLRGNEVIENASLNTPYRLYVVQNHYFMPANDKKLILHTHWPNAPYDKDLYISYEMDDNEDKNLIVYVDNYRINTIGNEGSYNVTGLAFKDIRFRVMVNVIDITDYYADISLQSLEPININIDPAPEDNLPSLEESNDPYIIGGIFDN